MLQSAPNLIRRLSWGMVSVVFIVGAVALVRDTVYQGQDFEVFWKTARFVLGGNPAYDPSRDGAMVFKYPPWIIPAFFPFATLSLSFGKWIWGVIQVFSLAYSAYWLIQRGCRAWVVVGGVLLFWGVWAVHALDGQITVCVLALSLWAMEKEGTARAVLLVWGLSVKIFSVFALIGARRRIMSLSTVVVVCGSLSALSVPACLSEPSKNPINLVKNWSLAARSAGERFEDEKIRGRENQGFPALVLRMSGVPARESHFDLGVAVFLALAAGLFWVRRSVALPPAIMWSGWLALVPMIHPLAWIHTFALAFPLCVFAVDQAIGSKESGRIIVATVGMIFVAVISRNTVGYRMGEWLELASVRSWGCTLCLLSLRGCFRTKSYCGA